MLEWSNLKWQCYQERIIVIKKLESDQGVEKFNQKRYLKRKSKLDRKKWVYYIFKINLSYDNIWESI